MFREDVEVPRVFSLSLYNTSFVEFSFRVNSKSTRDISNEFRSEFDSIET